MKPSPEAGNPTGLLIIRAWLEDGASEPLRAQVRVTSDVSGGFERTLTFVRTDEVCANVKEWLEAIRSDGGRRS